MLRRHLSSPASAFERQREHVRERQRKRHGCRRRRECRGLAWRAPSRGGSSEATASSPPLKFHFAERRREEGTASKKRRSTREAPALAPPATLAVQPGRTTSPVELRTLQAVRDPSGDRG
ncbi:MAG: hypothetical protein AMXMBFR37_05330 [Steroidobacteraceae bacterium]